MSYCFPLFCQELVDGCHIPSLFLSGVLFFSIFRQELTLFHFCDLFHILLLHVSVCMYVSVRVCALCVCAFGGLDASITSVCSYVFAS